MDGWRRPRFSKRGKHFRGTARNISSQVVFKQERSARTVKVSPPHPFFQPHTCVLSHFFRGRRIDYIVEKKLALDSFLSLSPRSEFFEKLANEGKEFLIFFGEFFDRFPRLEFIGICRDNRIFQSVISFN